MRAKARARRLRIVALFGIVVAFSRASMPLQATNHNLPVVASSSARGPVPSHDLRVYVVDDAGTAPGMLDVAMAEAGSIWSRAGLRLKWSVAPSTLSAPDGQSLIVIVRPQLRPVRSAIATSSSGHTHKPLGWLLFDGSGRPGSLIEVSFDAVASLVGKGSHMTFRIPALPDAERNRILGRGLGRVIAHEIGHWLIGRGHARAGLMKANFSPHDLIDPALPELPTGPAITQEPASDGHRR